MHKQTMDPADPSWEGGTDSLEPQSMPCTIVVIGSTGSGKSTFISHAIGRDVGIGHGLESYTEKIESFLVPHNIIREETEVILVDTPGFDNTNKPDDEIFLKVADWLTTEMKNKHDIAGLIYLHRIDNNRMTEGSSKTLDMFRKLCGKKMMTNVILMTSMWSDGRMSKQVRREEELTSRYFEEFIRLGATLTRCEKNQASIAGILEPLVYAWSLKADEEHLYRVARLQKKVEHYGLAIKETSAAREVYGRLQSVIEEHRSILVRVDNLGAKAGKNNPGAIKQALQDFERVIDDLVAIQEVAAQLHLPLTGRLKIFVSKIQRKVHPVIDIARQRQLSRIECQISLQGIQEGDKVIIVAGVTGSGMSTFISRALGEDVGARRAISTAEDRAIQKSRTRYVGFFRSSESKIVFVDTPGFDNDDPALSDPVIQNKIIRLVEDLPTKAKFSGFIFLHNAAKPACIVDLSKAIDPFAETLRKKVMTAAVVAIFKEKHADVPAATWKSVGKLSFPMEIFSDNRESVEAVLQMLLGQTEVTFIPPLIPSAQALHS